MFLIWGSKGFKEELGETKEPHNCYHCNNYNPFKHICVGRKFTIFFMSVFTISAKDYLVCPICEHGFEVNEKDVQKYLKHDNE